MKIPRKQPIKSELEFFTFTTLKGQVITWVTIDGIPRGVAIEYTAPPAPNGTHTHMAFQSSEQPNKGEQE